MFLTSQSLEPHGQPRPKLPRKPLVKAKHPQAVQRPTGLAEGLDDLRDLVEPLAIAEAQSDEARDIFPRTQSKIDGDADLPVDFRTQRWTLPPFVLDRNQKQSVVRQLVELPLDRRDDQRAIRLGSNVEHAL